MTRLGWRVQTDLANNTDATRHLEILDARSVHGSGRPLAGSGGCRSKGWSLLNPPLISTCTSCPALLKSHRRMTFPLNGRTQQTEVLWQVVGRLGSHDAPCRRDRRRGANAYAPGFSNVLEKTK
jgi:hypothetical protein